MSDRGWYRLTYVNLPTSGCETIAVVPGYYVRFAVTQQGFYGATGYNWIYNTYHHRFDGVATRW